MANTYIEKKKNRLAEEERMDAISDKVIGVLKAEKLTVSMAEEILDQAKGKVWELRDMKRL